MITVFDLVSTAALTTLSAAIGLGLINFVWQGTVIGLLTAAALRLLRTASPQLRYGIACVALMLCFALPAHTVLSALFANHSPQIANTTFFELDGAILANNDISGAWFWMQTHLMQLVGAWAICVAFFSIRLFTGLIWVARVSRNQNSAQHPYWQSRLNALTQRIGLKQAVRLHIVHDLTTPAVAGWIRPIVLVPATLITGMPPDLLEALLAHEVAHIRRMDYLVNLIQSTVEILLFYHPAVWFISRQIRIEREQIADDLAAQLIGEPRRLALALNELEQFQYAQTQLAMAANGGNLIGRIKRLIQPESHVNTQPIGIKATIAALSMVLAGTAFYANATDTSDSAQSSPEKVNAVIDFSTCDKPDYPMQSLSSKEEGMVRMAFLIDKNGQITNSTIKSSSGHPLLDNAALSALNKCKFKPATANGEIVRAWTKVDYIWKLPD